MRKEALRMEKVTYIEQGITLLENLNFQMFTGEIMGLVPLDSFGTDTLTKLLRFNGKLLYGKVYLHEKLVNAYFMNMNTENNVVSISGGNNLTEGLSAADNVFVIRRGYGPLFVRESLLEDQLGKLLEELKVQIDSDKPIKEMSVFEKYVITIIKAVVDRADLIILQDPASFLGGEERRELVRIIQHYAAKGNSFIYVSTQKEELFRSCDRISMMSKGSIVKVLDKEEFSHPVLEQYLVSYPLETGVRKAEKERGKETYVFECRNVGYRSVRNLSFQVRKGECLLLYTLGDLKENDLIDILCDKRPERGKILIHGKSCGKCRGYGVALILENPVKSMLFEELSCADNLCLTLDRKVKGIWRSHRKKQGIVRELLGKIDGTKRGRNMSVKEKYEIIYTRVLYESPEIVFCFYPYRNIDIELREHIEVLMKRFLEAGIAVVIVSVNLRDAIPLVDRAVLVNHGINRATIERDEFEKMIIE